MKLPRRKFLHLAASVVAVPVLSGIARAQAYPTRPVRVIVPFAAGGGVDIIARLMGQWLSEQLGQPFVIENRPGAGGNIGTEAVVRAPADGYTLLLITAANAINTTLYEKLSFNFVRDIAPVAGIMVVPNIMVVHPSVPAKTVPEFIAYAKANPGKINCVGPPGRSHVAGELFKMMTGVDMIHVPYRGGAPALTDLLGGQVQVMFLAMWVDRAHQSRHAARTGSDQREAFGGAAGNPDRRRICAELRDQQWYGIGAPKQTPTEIMTGSTNMSMRLCRPQDEGAPRRPRRHAAFRLACRLRQAHRRRNREVGQSDPGGQHQAGVSCHRPDIP